MGRSTFGVRGLVYGGQWLDICRSMRDAYSGGEFEIMTEKPKSLKSEMEARG